MASLIHVTYRESDGMWHLTKANSNRSTQSFQTQKEAVEAGKKYAMEVAGEVSIHGKDGKIQKGYNYGTSSPSKNKIPAAKSTAGKVETKKSK